MVKKEEYISCLYQIFKLPLEIVERIVYYLYTHQFQTPLELREALENYVESNFIYGDCNRWDVSRITDMSLLFANLNFDGDISLWDTSQVTNMQGMFFKSRFKGCISRWDVDKVRSFENMFADSNFTGDLSNWNFKSAINISFMFYNIAKPDKIILPSPKFKEAVVQQFVFSNNLGNKVKFTLNHIVCVEKIINY